MIKSDSFAEFDLLTEQIGTGVPNTQQYQEMSNLILDVPQARKLARMDPFKPGYKAAAMELYLFLRGRAEQGYVATRDEAPAGRLPDDLWTGVAPWAFRDAKMVSEHVLAWGHILGHLNLPPGGALLEYGPGSGQILLMASRMGYRACGVDIDAVALESIRAQAAHLDLPVEVERSEFGGGFDSQSFDTILFYEAFHHAFDFEDLLVHLHDRLKPGGRVVLCGEPVVGHASGGVPYPWGPRLDALSVFCMRRFGWMELGFTHRYLMKIARLKGWTPTLHPFLSCGRATIYVLKPTHRRQAASAPPSDARLSNKARTLQFELAAMRAPAFRRATGPIGASRHLHSVARTLRRWFR